LRAKKVIEGYTVKGSRFNLSPQELDKGAVRKAFAKAMKIDVIPNMQTTLPRALEFNLLGNIHYAHLDKTNSYEWFEDPYQKGSGRLYGGDSGLGGLSDVNWDDSARRYGGIGFRVLGRFSA